MKIQDARKQSREVLQERRKQVIRLNRKVMRVMQIVEFIGLGWCRECGNQSVSGDWNRSAKTGRASKKPGSGRLLCKEQESAVRQIICDKRPEQLKMDFELWNRAAVMQLIERECTKSRR